MHFKSIPFGIIKMIDYLIIYCHPFKGSFNHAILERVIQNLENNHRSYEVIDLYQDHFMPVYDEEELHLFKEGKTQDPLVLKYLNLFQSVRQVIFITPIWWNDVPGMLKGFIDKVMKEGPGLSHTVTSKGVKGELTQIKQAIVFTTSTSPTLYYRFLCGNGIKKIFINKTLKQLGIKKGRWINFGNITHSSREQRIHFLNQISKMKL
ncbi:NAD(P)H-dependent oxidoreductase [Xylocopilactobacillus apicola]|uniref:NAD(P)H dehydrogenase n=1 Tax=Xylocopilactobacillus apicola TaxID=2932184 RepID=A0AAU9D951_9LACO|nr:NAD(P)H-dependent oxidoreductase [Xylocopilactobacillus apicola]BDR58000.1 NAD(P)H dehydrogenase [Xylocopilactobacillus apicola]